MKRIYILLFCVVQLSCSTSEDDKLRFLKKGNVAFQNNNTADALRYYDEALKIDSAYIDAYYNSGLVMASMDKYDEAIGLYSKAIDIAPEFTPALFARATSHYLVKQDFAALNDIKILRTYWQDSAKVDFLEGLVYTQQERYLNALESFRAAQLLSPENQEITVNLGNTLYELGQFDEAKEILSQRFIIDHEQAVAYNTRGLIALAEGFPARANFFLDSALTLAPAEAYFLNNKGQVLYELNLLQEAETFYDRSMKLDPYNPWVYYNKGRLQMAMGNNTHALRLLDRANNLRSDPEIKLALIMVYQALGETEMACETIRDLSKEAIADLAIEYNCD